MTAMIPLPRICLARDAHNVFDESIATAAWKLKKRIFFYEEGWMGQASIRAKGSRARRSKKK